MSWRRNFSGVLAALAVASASIARAQSPAKVVVPDSAKLSRLVDLTSEVNHLQISYNPSDLDATVTLRVPGELTPAQLQDLLSQVLASKGLTTVHTAGSPVLSVVKLEQAAAASTLTGANAGASFITQVISAQHQPAKTLTESIRPLLSKPGGAATVLGDSNLIAISDFTARLAELEPLIAKLDTADSIALTDVDLSFVSPTSLITALTAVNTKREAAGGRKLQGDVIASPDGASVFVLAPAGGVQPWLNLIHQLDHREPSVTVTYTPRYYAAKDVAKLVESSVNPGGAGPAAGSDDRFRMVVDDLTGSLIVTATATQQEKVKALLDRLDSADRPSMPVRSYPIRNRPVPEVLDTLKQLIAAGVLESEAGSAARADVTAGSSQTTLRTPLLPPTGGPTAPNVVTAPVSPNAPVGVGTTAVRGSGTPTSRPSLSLTADEPTNTLIAIGEPRLLSQLETLLTKLDVRQPQVMLEVTLVSLTHSDALTLGAELERIGSLGNATTRLSSLFGLSTGAAGVRTVGDAAGFTGAVLNPGEFSIIVRALENLNRGRSLSNPKLLVSNNEKAVFSSTLQQPVQQQTRTGSNDTTFSYGGTENAGTTISVKPQIAQGDHLVLTYSIKLSSFVGSSTTAGLPPPKQENSVDSVATIPDGHTVVVGGLDIMSESKGESRIPGLGAIPLLGELFKTRSRADSTTRFFVFIKATVLRNGSFEDLKFLSAQDVAKASINDGFPEVLPRVIR